MCPLFSPRARKNAIIATPEYIAGSQVGSFTVVRYERGKAHKAFIIVISQSSFDDNTYLPIHSCPPPLLMLTQTYRRIT